jgi:hypothetical protein
MRGIFEFLRPNTGDKEASQLRGSGNYSNDIHNSPAVSMCDKGTYMKLAG